MDTELPSLTPPSSPPPVSLKTSSIWNQNLNKVVSNNKSIDDGYQSPSLNDNSNDSDFFREEYHLKNKLEENEYENTWQTKRFKREQPKKLEDKKYEYCLKYRRECILKRSMEQSILNPREDFLGADEWNKDELNEQISNLISTNPNLNSDMQSHRRVIISTEEYDAPPKEYPAITSPKFFKNCRKTQIDKNNYKPFNPIKAMEFINSNMDEDLLPSLESYKKNNYKKSISEARQNFKRLQMKKKMFIRNRRFKNKYHRYLDRVELMSQCFKCGRTDHKEEECENLPCLGYDDERDNADIYKNVEKYNTPKIEFDNMDDEKLQTYLASAFDEFGLKEYRSNQELVIKRILTGRSTLLIAPTGSGKSLCYQLAAYILWKLNGSITIVVSPLISLMRDQIKNFPKCLKGVCYNSGQEVAENEEAINKIIDGRAQILFLSPECLVYGLQTINFASFPHVGLICIDEVHCLAEWSTNFRPSYLQLYKTLKIKLNVDKVLAMTATATIKTAKMICKHLNLNFKTDVIGQTKIPDNLILTVWETDIKDFDLIKLLRQEPFVSLKSVIIYCTKREVTESVASHIRIALQFDSFYKDTKYFCEAYHAGLSKQQRREVQTKFMNGSLRIVVATIAFGMGIDKKDVRGIIHYNMPKSFENYLQEIGRAGRDGQQAYCHLFLDSRGYDLLTLQNFIYSNSIEKKNLRNFLRMVFQPCKCRLIAEELEENPNCPTHPVALPITNVEIETDIKSEVMHTLLLYLENIPEFPIKLLTPINSMCQMLNLGSKQEMDSLFKSDSILQIANFVIQRQLIYKRTNLKFSIVEIARIMGKSTIEIREHLKKLQRKNNKRSNIRVRFFNYSFHFNASGILTSEEIEQIENQLYKILKEFEHHEIQKLQFIYLKFKEFNMNGPNSQNQSNEVKEFSNNLKSFLNEYFCNDSLIDWSKWKPNKKHLPNVFQLVNDDYALVTHTITKFIDEYYDKGINTPMRMARFLQGISSPLFPAKTWSKHKYWGEVRKVDFKYLMELCDELCT